MRPRVSALLCVALLAPVVVAQVGPVTKGSRADLRGATTVYVVDGAREVAGTAPIVIVGAGALADIVGWLGDPRVAGCASTIAGAAAIATRVRAAVPPASLLARGATVQTCEVVDPCGNSLTIVVREAGWRTHTIEAHCEIVEQLEVVSEGYWQPLF